MAQPVITGIGIISSLGIGKDTVADALRAGTPGITDLTLFEPPGECEHAGEIDDYDWHDYLFSKQSYADRCTELAVGAARLCLEDGGISLPVTEEAEAVGLCFGTCWGCINSADKFYEPVAAGKGKRASSLVFSHSYPNCPASFIAIEMGLRGYSTSFAGDPQAGMWALRSATDAIVAGTATTLLVGAADALSPAVFAHYEALQTLPATRGIDIPAADDDLLGRIPGEGAVFFLLEEKNHAGERGGTILGSVPEAPPPVMKGGNTASVQPLLAIAAHLLVT